MLRRTCTQTDGRILVFQMFPSFFRPKWPLCTGVSPTQPESSAGSRVKDRKRGGGHCTCYSLSLQNEVLPTLPGSMCRRSQRRGGPMELRPESLPSPLHFLVPAQHVYASELGWGILLCFYPHSAAGSRAHRTLGTCFVPCQYKLTPSRPSLAAMHEMGCCERGEWTIHCLFISFTRRELMGPLHACILDSSPSVTCSGAELVHEINSSVSLYLLMSFSSLSLQYFILKNVPLWPLQSANLLLYIKGASQCVAISFTGLSISGET